MRFVDWGLIDYSKAWDQQKKILQDVIEKKCEDTFIFCSHPSVVTCGRGSKESDLISWSGPVIHVERGGRATYHGPNQLVVYPVIDLNLQRENIKSCDLRAFLKMLEIACSSVLLDCGVTQAFPSGESSAKNLKSLDKLSLTGVWVNSKKIASIGIAVRKWVTYHGLALNLYKDKLAFKGLKPCGFNPEIMTSVEDCLNQKISRNNVIDLFKKHLAKAFEFQL